MDRNGYIDLICATPGWMGFDHDRFYCEHLWGAHVLAGRIGGSEWLTDSGVRSVLRTAVVWC